MFSIVLLFHRGCCHREHSTSRARASRESDVMSQKSNITYTDVVVIGESQVTCRFVCHVTSYSRVRCFPRNQNQPTSWKVGNSKAMLADVKKGLGN